MYIPVSNIENIQITPELPFNDIYTLLNKTPYQTLIVINPQTKLIGVITPGDLDRFKISSQGSSTHSLLSSPADIICNKNMKFVTKDDFDNKFIDFKSLKFRVIPIVDKSGYLKGIYVNNKGDLIRKISNTSIGLSHLPYVISEIGVNHDGSLDIAKQLIYESKEAGANAVKFQHRNLELIYNQSNLNGSSDLSVEYTLDYLKKTNLSIEQISELFDYSRSIGISPICTPFDLKSLKEVVALEPVALKLSSADLTNLPLIEKASSASIPIIASTGMATEEEIYESVSVLKNNNPNLFVLHCQSVYPAPTNSLNLAYISRLRELLQVEIGYSSHDLTTHIPALAVAYGAVIIEKHITHNSDAIGPDHKASLEPEKFKLMVEQVKDAWFAKGTTRKRTLSQGELINRHNLGKSLYSTREIKKGDKLNPSDFIACSPGGGISPMQLKTIDNYKAAIDIKKDTILFESSINLEYSDSEENLPINNNWGIPVRYRDCDSLIDKFNPNFIEFHLTYKDMDLNPEDFIKNLDSINDFTVHAPECFENDHIIDLTSPDEKYRKISINHINKVCDRVRNLKELINPISSSIPLVINIGGFNREGFLSKEEIKARYKTLLISLKELNLENVELLPQTMPPFPWHLGGRSHHNLFVNYEDCLKWYEDTGHKVCFDLSHSFMACEFIGLDFNKFIDNISEITNYLHVSDASGIDQEGLTIGNGYIDFKYVKKIFSDKNMRYIPEIWQGHLNFGLGFRKALSKLNALGW